MKEIKFRGKRIDTGEWVYGNLIKDENKYYIITTIGYVSNETLDFANKYIECFAYEVIPETVGQYTGFKDVNGKKIYEGNTVKAWHDENDGLGYREYNDIGKIVWENGCWIIKMTSRDFAMALCDYDTELDVEVIKEV